MQVRRCIKERLYQRRMMESVSRPDLLMPTPNSGKDPTLVRKQQGLQRQRGLATEMKHALKKSWIETPLSSANI